MSGFDFGFERTNSPSVVGLAQMVQPQTLAVTQHSWVRGGAKSECRNPKQVRLTECQMARTREVDLLWASRATAESELMVAHSLISDSELAVG
ncbi:MAG: hypothetical protein CMJ48_00670 [Planctomycetaceae bacterium]|nr:hypothetical protein [Planctomycetaceae bacterium]